MDMQTSLFPSAYEVEAPEGAEDWRSLYPYYMLFQPDQREVEDAGFWFCNSQHWPTPFRPFDTIMVDFAIKTLGQYNTRHLKVPPANGIDYRILNGYVYFSPVGMPPEQIEARIPDFMERAGHYYQNWDSLLENWRGKVEGAVEELQAITFEDLPDAVPLDWVEEGRGLDNTFELRETYDRAIQLCYRIWQYHFSFLNLGCAAYLDFFDFFGFFGFMKEQFPTIPDQAIAKMVQGVDSALFHPDDEIKGLAKMAGESRCADALKSGDAETALAAAKDAPGGEAWLAKWHEVQDPWFNFTTGNGVYSSDKYWLDHLDIPMTYLCDYIERLEADETIDRPTETLVAERDRITNEYADAMDDEAREVFEQKLGLSRTVFPYVEDHNFYIEHRAIGVFWRRMRELSGVLVRGVLEGSRRHVLLHPKRGPRRSVGPCEGLGHRRALGRADLPAGPDRAAPGHHGGALLAAAAARAQQSARRHHRALHHHAVRHHERRRQELDRRGGRRLGG